MTLQRSGRRAKPRWLGLVALVGALTVLGVSSALAAPSEFVENSDTNIRYNSVGVFDWGNSGPTRTVAANGTVSLNGTGGVFDGGIQGATNSTPPTAPTLTAAAAANTQIVDADFIVDPLSSDSTNCGTGDPTTFGGAGSETNGGLISSFTFGTSGNTPPKNDLSNVYALSRDGDGRNEIFFGAERVVNNGDSHIDFEFLQSEVTRLPSATACAGTLSGDRTQGDLLLAIDFTNGGTFGGRTLYQWQCDKVYNAANDNTVCNPPASGKSVPHYAPVTSGAVAAALRFGVNSGGAVAGGGWTHRNSDGSPRADVITNAFMEGAIDLDALGFDGCVQTLLPHTRSSQSFTAVLKDFAAVAFDTCREPDITTQVKNTNGAATDTNVANGGPASVGDVLYDTATLTNATGTAGGTVDYYVEKDDATCSITGSTHLGQKTVTNGVVPNSNNYTITAAGTYYFWAVYSGDEKNTGDTSPCDSELVVVVLNPTTATTILKNTNGADPDTTVTDGASVTIPSTLYDTASLSGATATAGGTATYYYEKHVAGQPMTCENGIAIGGGTVTNGALPNSDNVTLSSAGTYDFWVVYSGDANNVGDTSGCGDETVVVSPNSPTFDTQPEVQIRDVISLSGLTSDATGDVTVKLFDPTNATCAAAGTAPALSLSLDIETDGTLSNGTWNYTTAYTGTAIDGTWRWQISYTGDANNSTSTSACGVESVAIDITPNPS